MSLTEEEARKRVKKIRGFYRHLQSYVFVNLGLFALNMFTSPGGWWFMFPALGWGIGLASHAASVFQIFGGGKEWEERKVRELMAAEQEFVSADRLYNILDERISTLNQPPAKEADIRKLAARLEALEKRLGESGATVAPSPAPKKSDKDALLKSILIPEDDTQRSGGNPASAGKNKAGA